MAVVELMLVLIGSSVAFWRQFRGCWVCCRCTAVQEWESSPEVLTLLWDRASVSREGNGSALVCSGIGWGLCSALRLWSASPPLSPEQHWALILQYCCAAFLVGGFWFFLQCNWKWDHLFFQDYFVALVLGCFFLIWPPLLPSSGLCTKQSVTLMPFLMSMHFEGPCWLNCFLIFSCCFLYCIQ